MRTGPQLRYELMKAAVGGSSVRRIPGSRERWLIRIDYSSLLGGRMSFSVNMGNDLTPTEHRDWASRITPASEVGARVVAALPGSVLVKADLKMLDRRVPANTNERWGEWITLKEFPVYEIMIEYPATAKARKDLPGSYRWEMLTPSERQRMIVHARKNLRANQTGLAGEIADARSALRRRDRAFVALIGLIDTRLWRMTQELADPAFQVAYRESLSPMRRTLRDARSALKTILKNPRLYGPYTVPVLRNFDALLGVVSRVSNDYPLIESIPLPE